ncbi:2-dehydropantoate 2-reductase (Ketopantoate reductase) (KPA reductase) (KPR) [Ciborinia camelliae]|nr:2-dehydropantoate 2-reductase (Ketopantoate reductase) (KPA reductase) (KPR) [Ciborinia camelliae]
MSKDRGPMIKIYHDGAWHGEGQYNVELISGTADQKYTDSKEISNLIVTTKSHKMVEALSMIKHRLTPTSTVLFIHNGMGVIEDVNTFVFPNAQDRPHYLSGIASHGVYQKTWNTAVLAGHGSITIGNPEIDEEKSLASGYLLRQVVDSKLLRATQVPWDEFRLLQLQKLAVNAVINPLTALNGCLNGEIVEPSPCMSGDMGNLFEGLVFEISQVLCSLPELQSIPSLKERFSTESLRKIILDVALATAQNRSSMLQDVSTGKETEIRSINGYIVKRAQELGIECPVNRKMVADILEAVSKQKLRPVYNEATNLEKNG